MGKWLIWMMCVINSTYVLSKLEVPDWCFVLYSFVSFIAYILWREEK